MKYIIQAQIKIEVEAENPEKARELGLGQFEKIIELGAVIEDAKLVDKRSGFVIQ